MNYKIIVDSGCDLTDEMKKELNIASVPLTLQLQEKRYIDDANLNIDEYLKDMKECPVSPKSACPAPGDFLKHYEGTDSTFVITISKELSATYNSAVIAKEIYQEDNTNKFIHVFNSKSASVGETLIALKIDELAKQSLSEEEIVEKVDEYINSMDTFFLLEDLDHLAKAGRLNKIVAKIASLLAIKPIMGATKEGAIRLVHKVRGYKKAFHKLLDTIGEFGKDLSSRILGIAHCNCIERAIEFKNEVLKRYNFKKIFITKMTGLTSTYADEGGLVIAF